MKLSFGIVVALALTAFAQPAFAIPPQNAAVNLISDPNFTGTLGSDGWNVYQASCTSNCETVTYNTSGGLAFAPFTGTLSPTNTIGAPASFAVFNANGGATGAYLDQHFATILGANYLLTYQYVPYGALNNPFSLLTEVADIGVHALVAFTHTNNSTSLDASALQTVSLFFVGTGNMFALMIEDTSAAGQGLPLITNVSVVNVPEPMSLAVMGIALVGLGVARRTRRI